MYAEWLWNRFPFYAGGYRLQVETIVSAQLDERLMRFITCQPDERLGMALPAVWGAVAERERQHRFWAGEALVHFNPVRGSESGLALRFPPPHDTLARCLWAANGAKRLGVRQSSGALKGATAFRVDEMLGTLTQGSACRATLG